MKLHPFHIFILLLLAIHYTSSAKAEAPSTVSGYQCWYGGLAKSITSSWATTQLPARQSACLAARTHTGATNGWLQNGWDPCVLQNPNTNANVYCSALPTCPDGNGGYEAPLPNGNCVDPNPEPEVCDIVVQGGLNPFLPDCTCPAGEVAVLEPENPTPNNPTTGKSGCASTAACPPSGSPIASGCTVGAFTDKYCLDQGNGTYCEAFRSNGNLAYTGTNRSFFCDSKIVSQVSVLGCTDIYTEAVDQLPPATTVPPVGSQLPPEEYGTTNEDIEDGARNKETTISGQQATDENGVTVQETNIANTYTDNSTGAQTSTNQQTTTTTLPSGRQTQVVRYTDENGNVTESSVGIDGKNECVGLLCGDFAEQGTGTTAGTCDTPPICTGTPLECAPMQQEWNLQCASTVENFVDCDAPISCIGDPIECEVAKQNKHFACLFFDDEGFDQDNSLLTVKEDVDDGTLYDGGEDVDVSEGFTEFDDSGFGWAGSCPAITTVTVLGVTLSFDLKPLCDVLILINPLVILLGMIHGVYILVRVFTDGG